MQATAENYISVAQVSADKSKSEMHFNFIRHGIRLELHVAGEIELPIIETVALVDDIRRAIGDVLSLRSRESEAATLPKTPAAPLKI